MSILTLKGSIYMLFGSDIQGISHLHFSWISFVVLDMKYYFESLLGILSVLIFVEKKALTWIHVSENDGKVSKRTKPLKGYY